MKKKKLDRRTVLKGGGALLALPFLEAMLPPMKTWASESSSLRFMGIFLTNGYYLSSTDQGDTKFKGDAKRKQKQLEIIKNFHISDYALAGLGDMREHISIYRNLRSNTKYRLTGHNALAHTTQVDFTDSSTGFNQIKNKLPRRSFDQYIADQLYVQGLPFRSISFSTSYNKRLSLRDGNLVRTEQDPIQLFDSLFLVGGNRQNNTSQLNESEQNELRRRKSILDLTSADIKKLTVRLGYFDKQTLDSHLTSIRETEKLVNGLLENVQSHNSPQCSFPSRKNISSGKNLNMSWNTDQYNNYFRAIMSLSSIAFRCDLTRCIMLAVNDAKNNFDGLDNRMKKNKAYHDYLAHIKFGGSNGKTPLYTNKVRSDLRKKVDRFYFDHYKNLLSDLDLTKDVDGNSMLHNSLIYLSSEMAVSTYHVREGMNHILAGNAGGALNPKGKFIDLPFSMNGRGGASFTACNDFQLAMMKKLGVNISKWGNGVNKPVKI